MNFKLYLLFFLSMSSFSQIHRNYEFVECMPSSEDIWQAAVQSWKIYLAVLGAREYKDEDGACTDMCYNAKGVFTDFYNCSHCGGIHLPNLQLKLSVVHLLSIGSLNSPLPDFWSLIYTQNKCTRQGEEKNCWNPTWMTSLLLLRTFGAPFTCAFWPGPPVCFFSQTGSKAPCSSIDRWV